MRARDILDQPHARFGFPVVMPRTPFLRGAEVEVFGSDDCEKIRRDARHLAGECPVRNDFA